MFLSGMWIRRNAENIFSPFDKNQIDCSAYTMKVGGQAYISPDKEAAKEKIIKLKKEESFDIPPGQFAYLITHEVVNIPFYLFALINIKNGLKVQGLINVSGFHVDPGYKGQLVFAVFNAGPKKIILKEGDNAFLIWLTRIEEPSEYLSYKGHGHTGISSKLVNNIPRQSASINSVSERLEKVEKKTNNYFKLFWASVGIIAAAVLPRILDVILQAGE